MDKIDKTITGKEIDKCIASFLKAYSNTSPELAATISKDNVVSILNMCIGLNEKEICSFVCLLIQILSLPSVMILQNNLQETLKYKIYEDF